MKSNDFIVEGYDDWARSELQQQADDLFWTEKEWIKIVKTIQRDCKPFLEQANGGTLYRGLGHENEGMLKKKVRLANREPKDMPQDIHDKLNKYFLMKHGAKFRNALFLSGSDMQAGEYGDLYKIFPIGRFEFLWSPKISDLYTEYEDYEGGFWHDLTPKEERAHKKKQLKRFHDEVLTKGYTTDHLAKAIKSGNEIMLRCNSYYAINSDGVDQLPKEWQAMLK